MNVNELKLCNAGHNDWMYFCVLLRPRDKVGHHVWNFERWWRRIRFLSCAQVEDVILNHSQSVTPCGDSLDSNQGFGMSDWNPGSCERHARYQVRSLNPRPFKIIGTHLSARAARVFTCFAPAT